MTESPKLVLWGYLHPDSVVTINVSTTTPPLSQSQDRYVPNGKVILWEDNVAIDTLSYKGSGNYKSPKSIKPMYKHLYFVTAESDGYPVAVSTPDSIPSKPIIISYEAHDSIGPGLSDQQVLAQIILNLESSSCNVDYIGINVEAPLDTLLTPGWAIPDYFKCVKDRFNVLKYIFSNIGCRQPITQLPLETGNLSKEELTQYIVTVSKVNPSAYEYHQKLSDLNTESDAGSQLNLFYVPAQLPENVSNGYGFVGGISTTQITVYF